MDYFNSSDASQFTVTKANINAAVDDWVGFMFDKADALAEKLQSINNIFSIVLSEECEVSLLARLVEETTIAVQLTRDQFLL